MEKKSRSSEFNDKLAIPQDASPEADFPDFPLSPFPCDRTPTFRAFAHGMLTCPLPSRYSVLLLFSG